MHQLPAAAVSAAGSLGLLRKLRSEAINSSQAILCGQCFGWLGYGVWGELFVGIEHISSSGLDCLIGFLSERLPCFTQFLQARRADVGDDFAHFAGQALIDLIQR